VRRSFRKLLNSDPSVNWLQPLPHDPPVVRRDVPLALARGRRVVHLGFTDERQTETKLREGRWLHAALADVAPELVGLDLDEAGVQQAVDAGYEAYVVDVQDADALAALAVEPADLVIAGEIIEHLENPGAFLRAVQQLLRPDGELVVTTPNAYRASGFFALVLGEELIHPDHVGIHSVHTLRTLGARAGYRVEHLGYYQNAPKIDTTSAGAVTKAVRGVQGVVSRRAPHWSDGIYAVYSLPRG